MMFEEVFYKNCKWLCLSVVLMILDIVVKSWIRTCFIYKEIFPVFTGVNFYYICNSGLAFGLFANIDDQYKWIFIWIVFLVIMIFLINSYRTVKLSWYENLAYSLIIGGAFGNFYDRVLHGTVIDFIDLYIGDWHWPTFNIADVEIFIGMTMLCTKYYFVKNCDL